MQTWRLTFLLLLAGSGCAPRTPVPTSSFPPTAAPTTAPTTRSLDALIQQLSSSDADQRRQASERLVRMGASARPALEAVVKAHDAAVEAIGRIDLNAVVSPTLITLRLTNARPKEIFQAIEKQSGYTFNYFRPDGWNRDDLPRASISFEEMPFWEAIRQACAKTGAKVTDDPFHTGKLRVSPPPMGGFLLGSSPYFSAGPFMMFISDIERNRTLALGNDGQDNNDLAVEMILLTEPKVKVLNAVSRPDLEEIVDNHCNDLIPARNHSAIVSGGPVGVLSRVRLALKYPKQNPGERIARLKGHLTLNVQTQSKELEVNDLLKAHDLTRCVGGWNITIQSAGIYRNDRDLYEVRLIVRRAGDNSMSASEIMKSPQMQLLDENGKVFHLIGGGVIGDGNEAEFKGGLLFENGTLHVGEPVKLVWEVPGDIHEVEVPFDFKNLPLP